MKAGYKTTEFWLTSLITVAGAVSSIANPEIFGKWGIIASAVAGAIYTIGRSIAKSGGEQK